MRDLFVQVQDLRGLVEDDYRGSQTSRECKETMMDRRHAAARREEGDGIRVELRVSASRLI